MKGVRNIALEMALRYVAEDPMGRLPSILSLAETLDQARVHTKEIQGVKSVLSDKNSVWYRFVEDFVGQVDLRSIQKLLECFIFEASMKGTAKARELERKHDCNIPWAILMDPTSACNLSCKGCWAAQYGDKNNLSYETLSSICKQGKELGIHFYLFSGGEPLVRKHDIIRLAEENQDCYFLSFTNGTLVDDDFCKDLSRAGNFTLAFSIEGDEDSTDMRRGKGTYRKVIAAMELMREHRLLFGYSTCYHRYNTESVGSDAFVDHMISLGCRFAWNFTFIPVGKDAPVELVATPEQRAYMYRRVREIRKTKPIFALDFWNDGEYIDGCIAGGRRYLHINAAGDVEPCAFVHYSNVNIHDTGLLDALRSPLFKAYRKRQPFNCNHLRPCPLMDNPDALRSMIKESGAKSTDMESPEDVDELCAKTDGAASKWAVTAERLWRDSPDQKDKAAGQS